jgi:hypothetical protein
MVPVVGWMWELDAAALTLNGATMASATLVRTIAGRTNFMNFPRIGVRGLIVSPLAQTLRAKPKEQPIG